MKTVVGISLGSGEHNFEFDTDFLGQRLKVWRLGTDASTTKTVKLLKAWERHADAIGIGVGIAVGEGVEIKHRVSAAGKGGGRNGEGRY